MTVVETSTTAFLDWLDGWFRRLPEAGAEGADGVARRVVTVIRKRSLSSAESTELPAWLEARPDLKRVVVVGDCTDLCVYQAAMHLRLRANAAGNRAFEVVVPADCVDTYDLPVAAAARLGAMPHDGELMHRLFLYHMALNGVQVVRSLR